MRNENIEIANVIRRSILIFDAYFFTTKKDTCIYRKKWDTVDEFSCLVNEAEKEQRSAPLIVLSYTVLFFPMKT